MRDAESRRNESRMHLAAKELDGAELRELIRGGASVDEKNARGETPLWVAASYGSLEGVAALIEAGASVNALNGSLERTALIAAVEAKNVEVCEALIAAGALPLADREGNAPLHYAAGGSLRMIELLESSGSWADQRNHRGETPERLALWLRLNRRAVPDGNIERLRELRETAPARRELIELEGLVPQAKGLPRRGSI